MSAPYQAVRASDGYFVMGANNRRLWQSLCEVIERRELLDDPRYKTIADRLANRIVLIEDLEKTFVTRPAAAWIDLLLSVGIPSGPILNYAETLGSEHARVREAVMEIDHPVEGKVKSIGFPVKLRSHPAAGAASIAASRRAQRRDFVELGYDEAARQELLKSGAVAG